MIENIQWRNKKENIQGEKENEPYLKTHSKTHYPGRGMAISLKVKFVVSFELRRQVEGLIIILNLNYYVCKFYIRTEMSGATICSVVNHLSC